MKNVEIYTKSTCGYCHAAKRLLTSKGVKFSEVSLSQTPDKKAEMIQRSNGGRTVPQIFIGKTHVGGWTRCWPHEGGADPDDGGG